MIIGFNVKVKNFVIKIFKISKVIRGIPKKGVYRRRKTI